MTTSRKVKNECSWLQVIWDTLSRKSVVNCDANNYSPHSDQLHVTGLWRLRLVRWLWPSLLIYRSTTGDKVERKNTWHSYEILVYVCCADVISGYEIWSCGSQVNNNIIHPVPAHNSPQLSVLVLCCLCSKCKSWWMLCMFSMAFIFLSMHNNSGLAGAGIIIISCKLFHSFYR